MEDNINYEDELEKFIPNNNGNNNGNNNENFNRNNIQPVNKNNSERASDLKYVVFDINQLPCGKFYPNGTVLKIRAAEVREIQAYSMVDDTNIFDIMDKANDIIANCVRLQDSNGDIHSYLELKDPDRFFLLFVIRDLTFQNGSVLTSKIECDCGHINDVILTRHNFNYYDIAPELLPFYDEYENVFKFELVNNTTYKLGVPTIGLQRSFYSYIVKNAKDKTNINAAFLKIVPFTISTRLSITEEGIKKLIRDFETMDDISFQFLNDAVNKMTFGIKESKTMCVACGQEAHAEFGFPEDKPSRLFVERNAFDRFIKKG